MTLQYPKKNQGAPNGHRMEYIVADIVISINKKKMDSMQICFYILTKHMVGRWVLWIPHQAEIFVFWLLLTTGIPRFHFPLKLPPASTSSPAAGITAVYLPLNML